LSDRPAAMTEGLRLFRADLHIHTVLSPCGSDDMTPPAIVKTARERGLDMIAICDHNSAGNVRAVQEAAGDHLVVLAGMELAGGEEAHVVGLFPDVETAEGVGSRLRALLPVADAGYYSFFGVQPLVAADGGPVGEESAALALAAPLALDETVALIHEAGGLAIAAHVDRRSFSVYSQLGFFPHDAGFDAVETSRHLPADSPRLEEFRALGLPVIGSSDAHYLEDIGSAVTGLRMAEPTFAELVLALAAANGRSAARA